LRVVRDSIVWGPNRPVTSDVVIQVHSLTFVNMPIQSLHTETEYEQYKYCHYEYQDIRCHYGITLTECNV